MKNLRCQFAFKTILISFILFGLMVSARGQESLEKMQQQAMGESLIPVRPGIPGEQDFWNAFAMRFIYAPAFEFKEIRNAVSYRFNALSFADKKTYTFNAEIPWAPLSPIWKSIPVGEVFLKVEGLDEQGSPIGLAGERKFYRASPFQGPYPGPKTDYTSAAIRQLDYIFHQDIVQCWLTEKKPDPGYILNAYISKMVNSTIRAMLKYIEINKDQNPENCRNALKIATNAADYLIGQSEPPDAPLAFIPPTYAGDKVAARHNKGKVMINVSAGTGQTYLALYDATGHKKYLQAAVNIANTLLKIQLPNGVWPIKMNLETGEEDSPNYGIPIGVSNFLEHVNTHHKNPEYLTASEKARQWTIDNTLKTFNWEGQFEDVQPSEIPYQKMGMGGPCGVARYLLEHREEDPAYLDQALEIIRFVEDQFVVWERPLPYGERGESTATWFTPSVLEQYTCYTPISTSVIGVSGIFYQAYKATGDELWLAKSRALANSVTQQQGEDGNIPTGWDTVPPTRIRFWWLNCALGNVSFLLQYDLGNQ